MKKGDFVIVRSTSAGVLAGNYQSHDKRGNVKLKRARQLWKWKAAQGGSLVDVAEFGVVDSDCKFSEAKATVNIFGACAIIACSGVAEKSIASVVGKKWN